ncbi:hypothetical protein B0H14DRAFT_2973720 [Mycena olivaceomarginata]|nr:hypothetical protein B0H14DRAFT_2973720 [Mycena olivaceomarginata]
MSTGNPFDDVLRRISDYFPEMQNDNNPLASLTPLGAFFFIFRAAVTSGTGHDKLPNYDGPDARTFDALKKILRMPQWFLRHLLKTGVKWNRQVLLAVVTWLLRVDASAVVEHIKKHRQATLLASSLISISPGVIFFPLLFLSILGFGAIGIKAGSPAAVYQRDTYGGFTPAGSGFSRLQSAGMRYHQYAPFLWTIRISSASAFVFAWNLE